MTMYTGPTSLLCVERCEVPDVLAVGQDEPREDA